jgi:hypothetical protein
VSVLWACLLHVCSPVQILYTDTISTAEPRSRSVTSLAYSLPRTATPSRPNRSTGARPSPIQASPRHRTGQDQPGQHVGLQRLQILPCRQRTCHPQILHDRETQPGPPRLHPASKTNDRDDRSSGIPSWQTSASTVAVQITQIRHARYRGLPKVHLQHVFSAVAINPIRLDAWWTDHPLDRTRTSQLAPGLTDRRPERDLVAQLGVRGGPPESDQRVQPRRRLVPGHLRRPRGQPQGLTPHAPRVAGPGQVGRLDRQVEVHVRGQLSIADAACQQLGLAVEPPSQLLLARVVGDRRPPPTSASRLRRLRSARCR